MASMTPYKLVSINEGRLIVVATTDIQTGELVMEEKEPVLYFSNETLESYHVESIPTETLTCFAAYDTFCALPLEKKTQLMSLPGPTCRHIAETYRMLASTCGFMLKNSSQLTPKEVETFVEVGCVTRFNMLSDADNNYIFEKVSHLAHSCQSNCNYKIEKGCCSVRAGKFIKAGEELTITYVEERDILSIPERRFLYLANKNITCHCPRCDAIGDDTRQFDCVDSACKGVMMVCQPVNDGPPPFPDCPYEGVTYVEPHLLPCTVCHRAAPDDYQGKMLALEAKVPFLLEHFEMIRNSDKAVLDGFNSLLAEIQDLHFPRRHLGILPFLSLEMSVCRNHLFRASFEDDIDNLEHCAAKVRRAALDCIEAIERVFPHAHLSPCRVLLTVVDVCITNWRQSQENKRYAERPRLLSPIFSSSEAKALLQKTLRMHLVLGSRECRSSVLDAALLHTLEEISQSSPPTGATSVAKLEVCAFCEESPQRATLTLSRCGRCRQVTYCSVGCQKAHWKLHKKSCKAVGAGAVV